MRLKKLNSKSILFIILIIGAFLRFYKLDWGNGLFTHPDEYHIVASVSQLSFPSQMNPHFFSYGTVVIYLVYFTKIALESLSPIFHLFFKLPLAEQPSIFNPFLIGRFYSVLFSTFTIIIVYKISSLLFEKRWALVATFLCALTAGLIQQAHFATPESILTFFLLSCLFFLLRFVEFRKTADIFLSSILLGLAIGVKIVAVLFIFLLVIGIILKLWQNKKKFLILPVNLAVVLMVFFLVAPFVFLDFKTWRGNTEYEGNLAFGRLPVFYTRQFIETQPFVFQLEKILPFTLGPVMELLGTLGLIYLIVRLVKKPDLQLFLLISSFLLLFISNSLLFAKWTRFIAPTFPFFTIFAAFFLSQLHNKNHQITNLITIILLITTCLWTAAFFSIYLHSDVRITASEWIESNFPANSTILIESGNTVDIPLGGNFRRLSFDFYNLEADVETRSKIAEGLEQTDYFLLQSRRVFTNHMRLPDKFPKTAHFYKALFNGSLGFKQIKQFDSFPQLNFFVYTIKFPDELAEETWSVFDHPVIRIYQKEKKYSANEYTQILNR